MFRKDTPASDEAAEVETGRNQEKDQFRIDSRPHSEIRISHHPRSAKTCWLFTPAHNTAAASPSFKRQYQLADPQSDSSNTVFVLSLKFACRPLNGLTQSPVSPSGPHPAVSPRKQWFDKLADAVLGDDDHTPSASMSRYALICEKCFSHNGLVKEALWADTREFLVISRNGTS